MGLYGLGGDLGVEDGGLALVYEDGPRRKLERVVRLRNASPGRWFRETLAILQGFTVGVVGTEVVFTARGRENRPGVAVAQARLQGAVMAAAEEAGVAFMELVASTIKLTVTGSGRATKEQVQACLRAWGFGIDLEPGLVTEHTMDAAAIGLCAVRKQVAAARLQPPARGRRKAAPAVEAALAQAKARRRQGRA